MKNKEDCQDISYEQFMKFSFDMRTTLYVITYNNYINYIQ